MTAAKKKSTKTKRVSITDLRNIIDALRIRIDNINNDRQKILDAYNIECARARELDKRLYQLQQIKEPSSANSTQVGGNHYKKDQIQPWDFINGNKLNYMEGSVVRYISRWRKDGGVQDLEKAAHYVQKMIEDEKKRQTGMNGAQAMDRVANKLREKSKEFVEQNTDNSDAVTGRFPSDV